MRHKVFRLKMSRYAVLAVPFLLLLQLCTHFYILYYVYTYYYMFLWKYCSTISRCIEPGIFWAQPKTSFMSEPEPSLALKSHFLPSPSPSSAWISNLLLSLRRAWLRFWICHQDEPGKLRFFVSSCPKL